MSILAHEALCFDSLQKRVCWWDDFEGDAIKSWWTTGFVGAGTVAPIQSLYGGVMRLTTGALANNVTTIHFGSIRSFHVDNRVVMDVRVKLSQVTQINVLLQLHYDADNRMNFRYAGGAAVGTWEIWNEDDTVVTSANAGVAPDTDFHSFIIDCSVSGEVRYYIDRVPTSNSPLTTNIPNDAADFLQPRLYVDTPEAVAKYIDVDYVVVKQDR